MPNSPLTCVIAHLTSSMAPIPDDVAMPPDRRGEAVHRSVRAVVELFLDGARPR